MNEIITKYGILRGISSAESYAEGGIKECSLNQYNRIKTSYGTFVPQYGDDGIRRKHIRSLSFYENENLKSISLHEQCSIETKYGSFPVEHIIFYENGSVKRIFPLNGKITGYWTEENEYSLAKEFEFTFSFGAVRKKIIGVLFYPSGEVKSLTFWPEEVTAIKTPVGLVDTRIGLSFYQDGMLKSCEPDKPTPICTPIGNIMAYDTNAIGVNGDRNSLVFYNDGKIKSLVTSTDGIEITDKNANIITFEPGSKPNLFNYDVMDIVPLKIDFFNNKVRINDNPENEYEIIEYSFLIRRSVKRLCSECSGCTACS